MGQSNDKIVPSPSTTSSGKVKQPRLKRPRFNGELGIVKARMDKNKLEKLEPEFCKDSIPIPRGLNKLSPALIIKYIDITSPDMKMKMKDEMINVMVYTSYPKSFMIMRKIGRWAKEAYNLYTVTLKVSQLSELCQCPLIISISETRNQ